MLLLLTFVRLKMFYRQQDTVFPLLDRYDSSTTCRGCGPPFPPLIELYCIVVAVGIVFRALGIAERRSFHLTLTNSWI